jgi:hypothetical protein
MMQTSLKTLVSQVLGFAVRLCPCSVRRETVRCARCAGSGVIFQMR